MSSVIGIAFGNTTSSIAVATPDGKVDVIANPDGDRAIPSALSYVGDDEYHGAQAVAQLVRNPKNTVINFRDFIGKSFQDIDLSKSQASAVPVDVNGKISYKLNPADKEISLSVDEIVKRHLVQIKEAAVDYTGTKVESVVITVPTNFTEVQKEELVKIAAEAGLNVIQLINEPTAALLAHLSAADRLLEDKIFVVADFGGIRSDAAVIAVRGGIFTVLASQHDFNLGGDSLDDALAEFFSKEFEKKFSANPRNSARSLAKLKAACIITKKTLSNVQTSTISIDSLADGFDFHSTINRLRFELVGRAVFTKMAEFVESTVKKAGLENLDIDEVLLVGGTSHIPKVSANMEAIFPETTVISKSVDPNELACRGAALQASMVSSFEKEEISESLQPVVVNTLHLAKPIGIKGASGEFISVLSQETAYPIKKSVIIESSAEDALVEIYEGERHVKETVVEAEKYSDDEEDDYSDEEPEVVKSVEYKPAELLAELVLPQVGAGSKVEVILSIDRENKLKITARSGAVVVSGTV
ncbi:unnamed protein product [Kuraishia capsulata CBS 1993]|uniref:Uncharacterized protein n=1 Tax=Kuraishia capsulata CBS 1993 TaxID=1382522 RepID=W6MXB9_9ASCO|nr:uncharacterized protein KUCA_T00004604001 [Kuraishia capsulata CBS 1993]CDK28620.1 unnamed protein product [Kuraishia capsulata CBS 1993]